MEVVDNAWGVPMTALALVSVLVIFGAALWFILSASDKNKRFRWLQIVGRRARDQRVRETEKWDQDAKPRREP